LYKVYDVFYEEDKIIRNYSYPAIPAKKSQSVKEVEQLTDPKQLANIAKTDGDWTVYIEPIRKLTGQAQLIDVAIDAGNKQVRLKMIENENIFTNQDVLAYIAKNDIDFDVRIAAIEKMTDPKKLT
jgi:predicted transcriptional regulator